MAMSPGAAAKSAGSTLRPMYQYEGRGGLRSMKPFLSYVRPMLRTSSQ